MEPYGWADYKTSISRVIVESDVVATNTAEWFRGCTNLTSVEFGDNVTWNFSNYSFDGCINLTNINYPENYGSIGIGCFENCRNLTDFVFSNSCTTIGSYAFYSCSSLNKITIPENVSEIDECAFWCSGLEEMVFESPADWFRYIPRFR